MRKQLQKFKRKDMPSLLFKFFLGLFVLLIPWQTRWLFYDWPLGIEVWEYGRLSLYGNAIILFIAGIFFALSHKKELGFSKSKFFYFIFFYSIFIGFISPAPLVSFYYLFLIYSVALFAYLIKFVPKLFIYKVFLFSGFIQGLIAVYQLIIQKVVANKWLGIAEHLPEQLGASVLEVNGQRVLRAYGTLPHPNILGGFLLVVIFAGLYLWIDFYKRGDKHSWFKFFSKTHFLELILIVTAIILSTYGLLASFSRSALLALILSIFSISLINIFKRNWTTVTVLVKYVILFLIVAWAFNLLMPNAWQSRWEMNNRLEQKSVTERISTLDQLGWDSYKHAFIGQGLGMNTLVTLEKHPNQAVYNVQPIHDVFILLLAELGLIGVFLLFNIVRLIVKSANQIDILSTSLILGLVIISLFDHYLWTSWTGLILISFGLVNLYKYRK